MSVDVLFEQAWDVAPFSDAAAGDVWMGNWCGRCVKDRAVRVGEGPGCPLVLVALMGRTPAPWLLPEVGGEFHCLEFRGEDDGPGPEPRPVPELGQPQATLVRAQDVVDLSLGSALDLGVQDHGQDQAAHRGHGGVGAASVHDGGGVLDGLLVIPAQRPPGVALGAVQLQHRGYV